MAEARELAEERMREIGGMSLDELLRFEDEPIDTEVTGSSGRHYRIRIHSFWDMEPYESDLYSRIKVTGKGMRSYQRYVVSSTRGPEDECEASPGGESHVTSAWAEVGAWAIGALVVLVLTVPWFIGVGYLVSRVL